MVIRCHSLLLDGGKWSGGMLEFGLKWGNL